MKKNITFLIVCVITLFCACSEEETIYTNEIQKKEITINKRSSKNSLTPNIVSNQIVIEFKKKGLNKDVKEEIRKDVQTRYHFLIDTIKKCNCNDNSIELWTINISNPLFLGIEDLVENLSNENDGAEDLNGNYQFTVFMKNVDQKTKDKNIIKIEERVLFGNSSDYVNIAIMDTGVDYDYLPNPILYNSSGDNSNCFNNEISGWDFVNNDNDPRDDHAHGTIVTEIIRDILTQENINYKILPVKVFNEKGRGTYFDILCGLKYIAAKQKPFLVNCSFGFYNLPNQTILENIIKNNSDNLLIIASAGNEGVDTDSNGNTHFPSGYDADNLLTVGGYIGNLFTIPYVGQQYVGGFDLAPESNYGNSSIDVVSTFKHNVVLHASNHYIKATVKGTSFSCPVVTSRAASMYFKASATPRILKNQVIYTSYKDISLRNKIKNNNILIRGYYRQNNPIGPTSATIQEN